MKKQEKSKSSDTSRAAEVLKKGGVVIFPTDTVYGIGCIINSLPGEARIKRIKKSEQKFPVLVENFQQLHQLARVTGPAQKLIDKHWPGALTILFESKHERQKIGIRMPKATNIRRLLTAVGAPLVATSANFHGQPTPKKYSELNESIKKLADYVLEGNCYEQQESTVVDTTVIPHKIIRKGAVKLHETRD